MRHFSQLHRKQTNVEKDGSGISTGESGDSQRHRRRMPRAATALGGVAALTLAAGLAAPVHAAGKLTGVWQGLDTPHQRLVLHSQAGSTVSGVWTTVDAAGRAQVYFARGKAADGVLDLTLYRLSGGFVKSDGDVQGDGSGKVQGDGSGFETDVQGDGSGFETDVQGDGSGKVQGDGSGKVQGDGSGITTDVQGDGSGITTDVQGDGSGKADVQGDGSGKRVGAVKAGSLQMVLNGCRAFGIAKLASSAKVQGDGSGKPSPTTDTDSSSKLTRLTRLSGVCGQ